MTKVNCFEDLDIWKKSIELSLSIYEITSRDKIKTDFGLKDQMQRASVSISSNIAEGFEYNNNKQFIRFLYYAKGSLGELRSQLFLLEKLEIISTKESNHLINICKQLSSMIYKFIKYLSEYKTENK